MRDLCPLPFISLLTYPPTLSFQRESRQTGNGTVLAAAYLTAREQSERVSGQAAGECVPSKAAAFEKSRGPPWSRAPSSVGKEAVVSYILSTVQKV